MQIRVDGIVQGVGFRPFVYNLARRMGLGGHVLNDSAGVLIEVEGEADTVEAFTAALRSEAPPLAWVRDVSKASLPLTASLPLNGGAEFTIRPSVAESGKFALVSADVATCDECLADIRDPENRRYRYPFTNCTNCGPRYTIIRDIPYDRPNTTMAPFAMCPACRAEYDDPGDRRFHAQPTACPECGPSLSDGVAEAQRRLAAGEILAIKGLGGFHLACDARNAAAAAALRARKRRSDKPFAVMVRDLAAARELCEVDEAAEHALTGPTHPIVILPRGAGAGLPREIAPGNPTLGILLPYTPLHHLLFEGAAFSALVMTSGNLSEEPIVVDNGDARARLGEVADGFLVHDREIYMRADDSVVRIFGGVERVMRRSRGYVPQTLDLGRALPELLACGGELKNTFCLTKGSHLILSQHIGDLENYETLVFYEETLANLKKLFRVTPRAVAYDLHPGYLSTKFALAIPDLPKSGVQHHHAHIASCMAENGLDGKVIGVAFDGTGYGPDGAIWGGEFLVAGYAEFERYAHLRYIPLAGGDAAVREPWRSAAGYTRRDTTIPGVDEARLHTVRGMIAGGTNTVLTSSCGRLFDAVAALAGVRREVTFEGQAAIELEAIADPACTLRYPFALAEGEVDFRPMIDCIVREREPASIVSARFHNTLAAAIHAVCVELRTQTSLVRVCLSGGTFQNLRLLGLTVRLLEEARFHVYLHRAVPPNDGGIALGQAAILAARLG